MGLISNLFGRNIVYLTQDRLTGDFYIGRHKTFSDKFDGYFGSGNWIKNMIQHGQQHRLERTTLRECQTEKETVRAEQELIVASFILNPTKCRNHPPSFLDMVLPGWRTS